MARYYSVSWNVSENNGYTATQTFGLENALRITVLTGLEYNFFVSSMTADEEVIGSWSKKGYKVAVPEYR